MLAAGSLVPNPTGVPKAYLNYLAFDLEHNPITVDQNDPPWKNVTTAAASSTAEMLALEYTAEVDGYMYIYVANETMEDVDVYFDDLTVTHTGINIVQSTDYYPGGLVLRETKDEPYRFGYQGQFSEYDSTIKMNQFQLRLYDPVTWRWNSVDPKRQHYSPYLGMGNDPVNRVDPDGGDDWYRNEGTGSVMYQEGSADIAGYKNLGASFDGLMADGTYFLGFEDGTSLTYLHNVVINSPDGARAKYEFAQNIRNATASMAPLAYGIVLAPAAIYSAPAFASGGSSLYSYASTVAANANSASIYAYIKFNSFYVSTATTGLISVQRFAHRAFSSGTAVDLRISSPRIGQAMRATLDQIMNLKLPTRGTPQIPLTPTGGRVGISSVMDLYRATPNH